MAVKRSKKKASKSKSAGEAYEQTMLAEGAPLALDLLGLGSTIGELITGKPSKPAKKKAAKKRKAAKKVKTSRKAPSAKKAKKVKGKKAKVKKAKKKAGRKARRRT